jgi:hypothetical protein
MSKEDHPLVEKSAYEDQWYLRDITSLTNRQNKH